METVTEVAQALVELQSNIPKRELALKYLKWVQDDGLEKLHQALLKELRGTSIEVPVYRADRLDEPLYYQMSTTSTLEDLNDVIAKHEGFQLGTFSTHEWEPDVTLPDVDKGNVQIQGRWSPFSEISPGKRFVVFPPIIQSSKKGWDLKVIKEDIYLHQEYISLHIDPAITTGADLKRYIWSRIRNYPPSEQFVIYRDSTEEVLDDVKLQPYIAGFEHEPRNHEVMINLSNGYGSIGIIVDVATTVKALLSYLPEAYLSEVPEPVLWVGDFNDWEGYEVEDDANFIYDVVARNIENKPYHVEPKAKPLPSKVIIIDVEPLIGS